MSAHIIPLSTASPPKPSPIHENRSQSPHMSCEALLPPPPHYSPRHALLPSSVYSFWPHGLVLQTLHAQEHLMVWQLTFVFKSSHKCSLSLQSLGSLSSLSLFLELPLTYDLIQVIHLFMNSLPQLECWLHDSTEFCWFCVLFTDSKSVVATQ